MSSLMIDQLQSTKTKGPQMAGPRLQHLPREFFDIYRQCKLGTRAVVTWLVNNGSCDCGHKDGFSVKDLEQFAAVIQSKDLAMPEAIFYQLCDTIKARVCLTKFFKRCDCSDNIRHENDTHDFFTASLQKIYLRFAQSSTNINRREALPSGIHLTQTVLETSNRFEALKVHSTNDGSGSTDRVYYNNTISVNNDAAKPAYCRQQHSPALVADVFGDTAELLQIAQEIHWLVGIACKSWAAAADGFVPAVVAALLTNVAFALLEDTEHRLYHHFGISNPDALQKIFSNIRGHLDPLMSSDGVSSLVEFTAIAALRQPWIALRQARKLDCCGNRSVGVIPRILSKHLNIATNVEGDEHYPRTLDVKDSQHGPNPSVRHHTTRPIKEVSVHLQPGLMTGDEGPLSALVKNICTLVEQENPPDAVIMLSSPLYADVGYFCSTQADYEKVSLRCTFGLRLMLETFKSQLRQSQSRSEKINYRIRSLQFAQQAVKSIQIVLDDSTMPCRCPQTIAFALQNVQEDLQRFTKRMAFDLYFQAPWVACSHMVEIMDVLFYYGVRLVAYRHYIGSVLHVYNVLRCLTDFAPVPLLGGLCEKLSKVVFSGYPPTRNFRSCYKRYMGGRLNVDKHKSRRHNSGGHHDAWQMTIPHDMARAAAGLGTRDATDDPRFDYRKLSLFHYIKEKKYYIDNHVHTQIRCHTLSTGQPPVQLQTVDEALPGEHASVPSHLPVCQQLLELQHAVLEDFTGSVPIARINFCAVYLACVRIVTAISDRWHQDAKSAKRCLCFVDTILAAADLLQEEKPGTVPARHPMLWKLCQEVILEVLGSCDVQDFLWQLD